MNCHPHFSRVTGEVEKACTLDCTLSEAWRGMSTLWNFLAVASRLQNFQQRIGNWTTQALKNCEAQFL
jgi:hypothetical protein